MMYSYLRCSLNCIRKLIICLGLIGIGYLLGNAFPTFEVRAIYTHALPDVPELEVDTVDFNDEVK